MKKVLFFIICTITFYSCTGKYGAETWVSCPCIVISNTSYNTSYFNGYLIKAKSSIEAYEYIEFYTTEYHNLGDTIK